MVAGRTAPNRTVRFGGEHDDLDVRGQRDVARLAVPAAPTYRVGPETSAVQTAEILGVRAEVDPALTTLDVGRWRGLAPEEVEAEADAVELWQWFTDPDTAPHGGETVRDFVARIRSVVRDGDALIVASPVAQAVACASAATYFVVDVRPSSVLSVNLS